MTFADPVTSLPADAITAGSFPAAYQLTGSILVGTPGGARITLDPTNGIQAYDATNVNTFTLDIQGNITARNSITVDDGTGNRAQLGWSVQLSNRTAGSDQPVNGAAIIDASAGSRSLPGGKVVLAFDSPFNSTTYTFPTRMELAPGTAADSGTLTLYGNIHATAAITAGGGFSGNLSGVAQYLAQSGNVGVGMVFNWSGQAGQPTWLWGGNDGVNMYVWNPSNFNVHRAEYLGPSITYSSAYVYAPGGDVGLLPAGPTNNSILRYKVYLPETYSNTSSSAGNVLIATSPQGILYRSTASSRRWKRDIADLGGALDPAPLLRLPVRMYRFLDDYLSADDERHGQLVPGFIAEELDELYPIAVDHDDTGAAHDWNPRLIVPALLALIQQLDARITPLERTHA